MIVIVDHSLPRSICSSFIHLYMRVEIGGRAYTRGCGNIWMTIVEVGVVQVQYGVLYGIEL